MSTEQLLRLHITEDWDCLSVFLFSDFTDSKISIYTSKPHIYCLMNIILALLYVLHEDSQT